MNGRKNPAARVPRAVPGPRHAPARPVDRDPDRMVVGVDGSDASVRALVWALREAHARGLRVEALTAWPLQGSVFVREVAGHFCEPRWRAREVQAAAVARALAAVADAPPYDLRVVNADLVDALVRSSSRAAAVVVGADDDVTDPGAGTARRERLTARLRHRLPELLVVVGPEGPDSAAETAAPPVHRSR